jgi:hypothetical protein
MALQGNAAGTNITDGSTRSDMTNETEKNPEQQKPQPGGSVNAPDKKANPSPENQGQGNRPQDISKKTPSQGDPQHEGQEKPEDEKRRAS